MKWCVPCAVLAISMCVAPSAFAQRYADWEPKMQGFRLGGEFDLWSANNPLGIGGADTSSNALVWDFVGQFAVRRTVMIDLDVPWTVLAVSGDDPQFVFGNVTFGAHWADKIAPEVALWVGGSLSLPSQLLNTSDESALNTASYAAFSRALYDSHRFVPDHLPLRAIVGVEWRIIPLLYFRSELNPDFMFKLSDSYGNDAAIVIFDQSNEIEFRYHGLGVGGRVQEAFFLNNEGLVNSGNGDVDHAQVAFEPFVGYEAPHRAGFWARLGFLTALDPPLGFGFDRGKVATMRLSLGGKW